MDAGLTASCGGEGRIVATKSARAVGQQRMTCVTPMSSEGREAPRRRPCSKISTKQSVAQKVIRLHEKVTSSQQTCGQTLPRLQVFGDCRGTR